MIRLLTVYIREFYFHAWINQPGDYHYPRTSCEYNAIEISKDLFQTLKEKQNRLSWIRLERDE